MEEKAKFKKTIVIIIVVVGIAFGFLALMNGRYIASNHREHHMVFDQWRGEYVRIQDHVR